MNRLGRIGCPDLPVKHAPQRWAAYLDDPAQAALLDGDRLLHTDFNLCVPRISSMAMASRVALPAVRQ